MARRVVVNAPGVSEVIGEINAKLIEGVMKESLKRIKRRTPVDTGRARASWEIANGMEIVSDVPYMEYLEYGTYKMRPYRMVTTTAKEIDAITKQVANKL